MNDFFNKHSSDIVYVLLIITAVVALILITRIVSKRLLINRQKNWTYSLTPSFNIARRILTILWIVLGLIGISLIFVDESKQASLNANFKLLLYLGVLSVITIVSASGINIWFGQVIKKRTLEGDDPTNFKFLRYVAIVCIYIIGILFGLLAIPSLHQVAQTALGGAGVLALVVGLSSQEALSNVVGGIFIIAFKPFRVGDIVEIDGSIRGVVHDITLRHTVIRTWQNKRVVIPNAIINKEKITNFDLDEEKYCEYIVMGISYDSDVDLAKKIMTEEIEKHPDILDNRTEAQKEEGRPMIRIALIEFGDSSVNIRAWAWGASYGKALGIKRDVYETIKKRFEAEGIDIPFPHRTVIMKEEEK